MRLLRKFRDDCRGATAVEYGLLAAILSVGLIVGLSAYYDGMQNVFGGVSNTYLRATTAG